MVPHSWGPAISDFTVFKHGTKVGINHSIRCKNSCFKMHLSVNTSLDMHVTPGTKDAVQIVL